MAQYRGNSKANHWTGAADDYNNAAGFRGDEVTFGATDVASIGCSGEFGGYCFPLAGG